MLKNTTYNTAAKKLCEIKKIENGKQTQVYPA